MNEFKERIKVQETRSFYKTYEKGKDGRKIYKGSIPPEGEFNSNNYLGVVSGFILDEQGNVCVEKRANTKLQPGELDIVSRTYQ